MVGSLTWPSRSAMVVHCKAPAAEELYRAAVRWPRILDSFGRPARQEPVMFRTSPPTAPRLRHAPDPQACGLHPQRYLSALPATLW